MTNKLTTKISIDVKNNKKKYTQIQINEDYYTKQNKQKNYYYEKCF